MKYSVSKTYQVVTNESAERGDFDECGFEFEDHKCDTLAEVAREFDELGYYEDNRDGSFYSSDPEIDYTSGDQTFYALHVSRDVDGYVPGDDRLYLSDQEIRVLNYLVRRQQRPAWRR